VTPMTKSSWDQRSGSGSDGSGNLGNAMAHEPLKENSHKYFPHSGHKLIRFEGHGAKVRVREMFSDEGISIDRLPLETI